MWGRPHHLAGPGREDVEERLGQTSLYGPTFDLVVLVGFVAHTRTDVFAGRVRGAAE